MTDLTSLLEALRILRMGTFEERARAAVALGAKPVPLIGVLLLELDEAQRRLTMVRNFRRTISARATDGVDRIAVIGQLDTALGDYLTRPQSSLESQVYSEIEEKLKALDHVVIDAGTVAPSAVEIRQLQRDYATGGLGPDPYLLMAEAVSSETCPECGGPGHLAPLAGGVHHALVFMHSVACRRRDYMFAAAPSSDWDFSGFAINPGVPSAVFDNTSTSYEASELGQSSDPGLPDPVHPAPTPKPDNPTKEKGQGHGGKRK